MEELKQVKKRVEKDLLGEKEIEEGAYYGIHTLRAQENFSVSGMRIHPELISAMATVKKAAALANMEIGLLERVKGKAIVEAADEVSRGGLHEHVLVDPLQGGAGTSLNMNINEIIANRAIELLGGRKGDYDLIHPLNHVNLSQSTNDVFPTAVRIAAIKLVRDVSSAMAYLQGALQNRERAFASVLKVGRTELQDAVPVTLGQEFGAWAEAIARDWWRLYKAEERLRQVNIGGTMVGTGLNASRRYINRVIEILRELTGFGLSRAENTFEATQNTDILAEVSGFLKTAAVNLAKIASDLRLLSSGPKAGLGEIRLPPVQAGSSIMPGKVNPVIPEMVTQIAYQVMANDQAIVFACASGQLELNAFYPLIAHNLLQSMTILANGTRILADRCIRGILADHERCEELLKKSDALITALVPYLGYIKAQEVVVKAKERKLSIETILLEEGLFSQEELKAIMKPEELTTPGIAGARYMRGRRKKNEP
ncbi:MAG: aspartate ammonia-lyase [Syntrophales bacterium]|nr:aspartate ammonia-lyase [Syntrophales bacterium]